MGLPERGQILHDVGMQGRGLAGDGIDMERHQLGGRGQIALVRMVHAVEKVDPLLVETQKLGREAQGIAQLDLAVVGDVSLDGEGGAVGARAISGVEADMVEERVGGVVEGEDVIGHVHVAVVIDPRLANGFGVQGKGLYVSHGAGRIAD